MPKKIYKFLFDGTSAAWTAIFTGVLTLFTFFVYQVADRSDETARTSQRAFIILQKVQASRITHYAPSGDIDSWQIFATWQNAGTTPASGVFTRFSHDVLSNEPDDRTFRGASDTTTKYVPSYIGPKETKNTAPIYKPLSFFPVDRTQTVYSRENRFFWGWVVYHDAFPKTPPRLTEFCQLLISVSSPEGNSRDLPLFFAECVHHNCADEDCEDYKEVTDMAAQIQSIPPIAPPGTRR